jgi:phage FluMu protein Com
MRHRAAKLAIILACALASYAAADTAPPIVTAAPGAPGARANVAVADVNSAGPAPQRRAQTRRPPTRTPRAATPRTDYTRFQHSTEAHRRACDSCHEFPSANWKEVRKADEAFEDVSEYPEHASCIDCHRAQFFARERPQPRVCSVCHVGVTPKDQARKPFPNPLERFRESGWARDFDSDFRVFFPHEKHADLFGMNANPEGRGVRFVTARHRPQDAARDNASCANCHQVYRPQGKSDDEYATKPPKDLGDDYWLKKGTFMTTPTSHSTCFTCHSAESGMKPGPADCATCHRLPPAGSQTARKDFDPQTPARVGVTDLVVLSKWRRRDSAATFRHEGGMHPELSCATCHKVNAMDTSDERTTSVRAMSCGGGEGGCHVTPTSDDGGVFNFEMDQRKANAAFRCTKCHLVYGTLPAPASHAGAIPKPKPD